jgi:hypothetical protein
MCESSIQSCVCGCRIAAVQVLPKLPLQSSMHVHSCRPALRKLCSSTSSAACCSTKQHGIHTSQHAQQPQPLCHHTHCWASQQYDIQFRCCAAYHPILKIRPANSSQLLMSDTHSANAPAAAIMTIVQTHQLHISTCFAPMLYSSPETQTLARQTRSATCIHLRCKLHTAVTAASIHTTAPTITLLAALAAACPQKLQPRWLCIYYCCRHSLSCDLQHYTIN